jgi:hypothetical protein
VIDAFDVALYLYVRSAEKRSGKTRLLELIEVLVARAWRVVGPSAPTVFRKIQAAHPTLLIDEIDAIFTAKLGEMAEALRAVLNAGYRRGATVPRVVGIGTPGERVVEFDVFGPKAMAGLHALPDTTADPTITLALLRRKKSEAVKRFRFRRVMTETVPPRAALAACAVAAHEPLRAAEPSVPEVLDDRQAEIWNHSSPSLIS